MSSPRAKPRFYGRRSDITKLVVPGSGHCHNTASTRHLRWRRLLAWTEHIARQPDG